MQQQKDIDATDNNAELEAQYKPARHDVNAAVPVSSLAELNERSYGQWQGKRWKELDTTYAAIAHLPDFRPPEGETLKELSQRAYDVVLKIATAHEGSVLVVSHGGTIGELLKVIVADGQHPLLSNCSIVKVSYEGGKFALLEVLTAEHVPEYS